MVAVIAAILIASWIVGQGDGNGSSNVDALPAQRAWLYVAIVAVGYVVSRGLAKREAETLYWSGGSGIPGIDDSNSKLSRAGD